MLPVRRVLRHRWERLEERADIRLGRGHLGAENANEIGDHTLCAAFLTRQAAGTHQHAQRVDAAGVLIPREYKCMLKLFHHRAPKALPIPEHDFKGAVPQRQFKTMSS
jgi:hypothetical protein